VANEKTLAQAWLESSIFLIILRFFSKNGIKTFRLVAVDHSHPNKKNNILMQLSIK
jgi:hypothetical protein